MVWKFRWKSWRGELVDGKGNLVIGEKCVECRVQCWTKFKVLRRRERTERWKVIEDQ